MATVENFIGVLAGIAAIVITAVFTRIRTRQHEAELTEAKEAHRKTRKDYDTAVNTWTANAAEYRKKIDEYLNDLSRLNGDYLKVQTDLESYKSAESSLQETISNQAVTIQNLNGDMKLKDEAIKTLEEAIIELTKAKEQPSDLLPVSDKELAKHYDNSPEIPDWTQEIFDTVLKEGMGNGESVTEEPQLELQPIYPELQPVSEEKKPAKEGRKRRPSRAKKSK